MMKQIVDFRKILNAPKILVNCAHKKYLCVLYASEDKQGILPYSAWSDCFQNRHLGGLLRSTKWVLNVTNNVSCLWTYSRSF
jgi:hypothetical protein